MRMIFLISILFFSNCQSSKIKSIESYLDIEGNKIHYKIDGDGQEVLFIHGGYLNLDMWDTQVRELASEYKTIRFSDIGHGMTQSSENRVFGYEIIEHLISSSDSNKVTLIGLSWGAMLCIDYALKYPYKIEKLILISPGLNGWDYFQDTIAARNNALRQVAIEQNNMERAAELFHQNWVVGPRRKSTEIENNFYERSLALISSTMNNHWKEDWSKLDSIPAIERLEQISIPTFIVVGDQDARDIALIAKTYDDRIPHSTKIVMKDVAHLLNMEHPKEFNRILREILKE